MDAQRGYCLERPSVYEVTSRQESIHMEEAIFMENVEATAAEESLRVSDDLS